MSVFSSTLLLLVGCLVRGQLIIDTNRCASGVVVDVLNPLYTSFFGLNRVTLASRVWLVFNSGLKYRPGIELSIGSARQYINANATEVEVSLPHSDPRGRVVVTFTLGGTRIKREFVKSSLGPRDETSEPLYRLSSDLCPAASPLPVNATENASGDSKEATSVGSRSIKSNDGVTDVVGAVGAGDEAEAHDIGAVSEPAGEVDGESGEDGRDNVSEETFDSEPTQGSTNTSTRRRGSTSSTASTTSTGSVASGISGAGIIDRIRKAFNPNAPLDVVEENLKDETIQWRKIQTLETEPGTELVCLRFKNVDNAYNRIHVNKVHVPVPSSASNFEVAFLKSLPPEDGQESFSKDIAPLYEYRVVVASHIGEVWVEAFYSVVNGKLLPCTDFDTFKGVNVLSSRKFDIGGINLAALESLEVDVFNEKWLKNSDVVDFATTRHCRLFRPSAHSPQHKNPTHRIDALVFGKTSVKLGHANSQEFAMAATCTLDSQVWVLVVTTQQWLYTTRLWRAPNKESAFVEINYNSPGSILPIISQVYGALQNLHAPTIWSELQEFAETKVPDDVLCLGNISILSKTSYAGCKSLHQLKHFEGVMLGAIFNVLKYKGKTEQDKALVQIGNVLVEMEPDPQGDCSIYYAQEPDKRRQVLFKCPAGTRAIAETGPNTNHFVPVEDSWSRAPLHTHRINVDVGAKSLSQENDLAWKYDPNVERWVLSPKYPGTTFGDITYGNKIVKCGTGRGCGFSSVSKANLDDGDTGGIRVHLARSSEHLVGTIQVGYTNAANL